MNSYLIAARFLSSRDDLPVPPVDHPVDPTGQLIMTIGTGLAAVAFWALACLIARRQRTVVPILIMLSGLCCLGLELVYDNNFRVWFYDSPDTWVVYHAYGVAHPWWLVLTYTWCYGGLGLLVWRKIQSGGNRSDVYRLGGVFAAVYTAFEVIGINLGTYEYYGPSPFRLFNFPLWLSFSNMVVPMVMGVAVAWVCRSVTGSRTWAILVVGPASFAMMQFLLFPALVAINTAGVPTPVLYGAVIVALGFGTVTLRLIMSTIPVQRNASLEAPELALR
jgi:hypothetical protein